MSLRIPDGTGSPGRPNESTAGEMLANVFLDEQRDEVADGTRCESRVFSPDDGIDEIRHDVGKLLNQAPFDASD